MATIWFPTLQPNTAGIQPVRSVALAVRCTQVIFNQSDSTSQIQPVRSVVAAPSCTPSAPVSTHNPKKEWFWILNFAPNFGFDTALTLQCQLEVLQGGKGVFWKGDRDMFVHLNFLGGWRWNEEKEGGRQVFAGGKGGFWEGDRDMQWLVTATLYLPGRPTHPPSAYQTLLHLCTMPCHLL